MIIFLTFAITLAPLACVSGVFFYLLWKLYNLSLECSHREVPVTEASVVIAVSSPHRQESLEAVHYAIDSLKASVPIWKKVHCNGYLK